MLIAKQYLHGGSAWNALWNADEFTRNPKRARQSLVSENPQLPEGFGQQRAINFADPPEFRQDKCAATASCQDHKSQKGSCVRARP
jgi:hypothetical protein